jgi:hypothetical protein
VSLSTSVRSEIKRDEYQIPRNIRSIVGRILLDIIDLPAGGHADLDIGLVCLWVCDELFLEGCFQVDVRCLCYVSLIHDDAGYGVDLEMIGHPAVIYIFDTVDDGASGNTRSLTVREWVCPYHPWFHRHIQRYSRA